MRIGFRRSLRRWPLVLVLWQVNLLFGGVFAGLGATMLGTALDGSWFTRSLLYDLDVTALVALVVQSAPALKLLGGAAVTLGILYMVGWFGLHGAVVAAVCDDVAEVSEALQAGARLMALFFRIWCVAIAVTAAAVGPIVIATAVTLRLAQSMAFERLGEIAAAAGAALGLGVIVALVAVHDHARLRAVMSEDGAWKSYAWAFRFVVRTGGVRVLGVALALHGVGLALWGIYQACAAAVPANWMAGVVAGIVWGQLFMMARMLMRVWAFAAQAELQSAAAGAPVEPGVFPG